MRRPAACTISRVGGDITYELNPPQPLDVLSQARFGQERRSRSSTATSRRSRHYKALRKKLAEARGNKGGNAPAQIARGPVLELATDKKDQADDPDDGRARAGSCARSSGLPAVRDDLFYDKPLADAVAQFQKEKGLPANGRLTNRPSMRFNGKRHERDDQIIMANMERWRWVPRDLGRAHVVLNIPDFTLQVYENGAIDLANQGRGRQAGGHATPLLSETMKYITVNPTWNVPPSIVYNEYLPALQQDPTVLKRMGLNLRSGRTARCTSRSRRAPKNALGRIRFNFPNKFLVYQHDTPDKHLFAHSRRAYSHGCMRVENPAKYAEIMTRLGDAGIELQRREDQEHVRQLRDRLALHQPDPGAHHLSDGIR